VFAWPLFPWGLRCKAFVRWHESLHCSTAAVPYNSSINQNAFEIKSSVRYCEERSNPIFVPVGFSLQNLCAVARDPALLTIEGYLKDFSARQKKIKNLTLTCSFDLIQKNQKIKSAG
jgi:hypothetical protein